MERLPDEVTTPRLVLRRWHRADVAMLRGAIEASIEHLRPWMAWVAFEPLSDADRAELIESWDSDHDDVGDAIFGVFSDGTVVGGCGLHRRRGPDTLEIGYWIHVDHVRRGYATELVVGLTTAAFEIDGIERVEVHHDKANIASAGVPRGLGFERGQERPDEPVAPAEVGIDCTWSVSRADWANRQH